MPSRDQTRGAPRVPTVSVLIPCYNECRRIRACMESLLASDYPADRFELVVIDGQSDDGSRAVVEQLARTHGNVRLLDNPARQKSHGLNLAIQATRSEVVLRADAHAWYPRDYIRRLVEDLDRYGADNTGGIRNTHVGGDRMAQAIGIAISHRFAAGNAHYRVGSSRVRPVESVFGGCYRREVFERVGFFNERLIRTQDREFNRRLLAAGGRIVLDPEVRCTYYPRQRIRDYWRWNYNGAFWLFYARRFTDVPMVSWRNLVPLAFVLWHVMTVVSGGVSPLLATLATVPIAGYWLCNVAVSWQAARRHHDALLTPYLVLVFMLTHWGYGLGSFGGWLRSLPSRRAR